MFRKKSLRTLYNLYSLLFLVFVGKGVEKKSIYIRKK